MAFAFVIPGPLRDLAGNRSEIRVAGSAATVADALGLLWEECPAIRDRIVTERGELRPHVNVFADGESVRDLDGLGSAVRDGAEIVILPAISGG